MKVFAYQDGELCQKDADLYIATIGKKTYRILVDDGYLENWERKGTISISLKNKKITCALLDVDGGLICVGEELPDITDSADKLVVNPEGKILSYPKWDVFKEMVTQNFINKWIEKKTNTLS